MNKLTGIKLLVLGLVLTLSVACDRLPTQLLGRDGNTTAVVTIGQIAETGQPGEFTVAGTANLPDLTELTVSALRPLPVEAADRNVGDNGFAILDRKSATVRDGRWQTDLSLWEASPAGYYQENWQQSGTLGAPSPTVEFWATLESRTLNQNKIDIERFAIDPDGEVAVGATPEGEPFLRVKAVRAIAPPSPQARATSRLPDAEQNPWQGRSSLSSIPGGATDGSPLPFENRDNLPLPQGNLLR